MDCKSESASHYAGCPCNEEHWREQLAAAESARERAEKERDEARDCGNSTTEDACGECRACWLITKASLCGRVAAAESALASEREAHEKTKRERDAWIETARQDSRNREYYRGLIVTTLSKTPDAFLCDDGSRSEDVLCAKLPELWAAAEARAERAEAAHAGCGAQVRELVSKALRAVRGQEAAESRAERLAEALREIDARTGHFGEAPPPPEWMPMLSLIAWVGRTARAALAEHRDAKGEEAKP